MRLSEQIDDTTTDVTFNSAQSCELNCNQLMWINNHYLKTIPQYKPLMDEYNRELTRNRRLKKFKVFPSKHNWTPSDRCLTALEKELLNGPSPTIKVLKKVQLKVPGTGRWVTYNTRTQCMRPSPRVSSSYVCVNHSIAGTCRPKFGIITKLILHNFIGRDTLLAEIRLLGSSKFDAELAMWYAKCVEDKEQLQIGYDLYALQDVSEPLVVACEKENITTTCIWFLNYHL